MNTHFSSSDAWVLAALSQSHGNGQVIDHAAVQRVGDHLNHAILTPDEIDSSVKKFEAAGFLTITDDACSWTELGEQMLTSLKDVPSSELIAACEEQLNIHHS